MDVAHIDQAATTLLRVTPDSLMSDVPDAAHLDQGGVSRAVMSHSKGAHQFEWTGTSWRRTTAEETGVAVTTSVS